MGVEPEAGHDPTGSFSSHRFASRIGWITASLGAAAAVFTTWRPDEVALMMLAPVWVWPLGGVACAVAIRKLLPPRGLWLLLGFWLCWLVVCEESVWSLPRGLARAPEPGPKMIRVISLNCAGGSVEAAGEALRLRPDVLLLQESPAPTAMRALLAGSALGYEAYSGFDATILARGTIRAITAPSFRGAGVAAEVRRPGRDTLRVVSLRLSPPTMRLDFWRPSAWKAETETVRLHRQQLRELMAEVRLSRDSTGVIVGGDFNCPAGDGALSPLHPLLHDAFRAAGTGWGATILNDLPVHRIDQVWTSRDLRPRRVVAHTTRHSDHRLVLCDLD